MSVVRRLLYRALAAIVRALTTIARALTTWLERHEDGVVYLAGYDPGPAWRVERVEYVNATGEVATRIEQSDVDWPN